MAAQRSRMTYDGGGQRRRRGSKAAGAIAGRRQILFMVEAADGEGGNSGAGMLSDGSFQ